MRGLNFRCKIGVLRENGIESVYCHEKGEPENTGVVLRDYYPLDRANELLKLGDISYLKESIENSNFYNRDREVPLYEVESRLYPDEESFLSVGPVDYFYVLRNDGWYVKSMSNLDNYRSINDFVTVDEALLVKPSYKKREEVKTPKW